MTIYRDPSTITIGLGRTLADVLADHAQWLTGPQLEQLAIDAAKAARGGA